MIEQHQDSIDFSQVPVSQGMSNVTLFIVFTGVIVIFLVGGLAVGFAGYGHIWPSTHSERLPLGSMPGSIQ
jgi:hypothetical protein